MIAFLHTDYALAIACFMLGLLVAGYWIPKARKTNDTTKEKS